MLRRAGYAKLNLVLRVDPPVESGEHRGWHPICSWMHAIDLADDIEFERLDEGEASSLEVLWADDAPRPTEIDWEPDKDLAWRAHTALEVHCRRELPVAIQVHKRIPVGAGLGGGSVDCAGVLAGLDEVFQLGLGEPALREIGLALGSDVPFLVDRQSPVRPAVVSGFGETIERVGRRSGPVTLILPGDACSTGEVYRAFDAMGSRSAGTSNDEIERLARAESIEDTLLFNDLTEAAMRVAPALGAMHAAVSEAASPARVHLSGSGSAMFILGEPSAAVRAAAERHGAAVVATSLR